MATHDLTLTGCAEAIARGELTAVDATKASLARIDALNLSLNAYLHVDREGALEQAARADQAPRGERGPLHGVPVSIKDLIGVSGMPLTAGSRILHGYVPPYDATVVARLKAAGAVVLGKTNLDEFAMGSANDNSAFGPVRNPWHLAMVPGGSSGGSAAAVAAGMGFASLGTDTGGSIRQPAALCGVVGLKPTYGRVSRYGAVAYASSLDQIGPLTRTVRDAARLLQVIGGVDAHDGTSAPEPQPDYENALTGELRGIRLGVPREYLDAAEGLDAGVRARIEQALVVLQQLGATLVPVSLPHTRYCVATYYLIATAEASTNLARYDGVRFGHRADPGPDGTLAELYALSRGQGFGPEVKRRIVLGTFALSAGYHDEYYKKACQVRRLIHDDFAAAFSQCDALVGPTSPVTAWPIGTKRTHAGSQHRDPLAMYLMDIFTLSTNLAGLPGLSVPTPLHDNGLPVGLQLTGRPWAEATLLRIGDAYTQATGSDRLRPDLSAGVLEAHADTV